MKHILLFFTIFILVGCNKNDNAAVTSPPPSDQQTSVQNISDIAFRSIKEVELTDLSEATLVRVGLSNDTAVISMMMNSGTAISFKTIVIRNMKADDKKAIQHEETQILGLFERQFNSQIQSSRKVRTHFAEFKKLMQAYHLRDIYRCRTSKLWPKLVDYTPDRRGPGMLRLRDELYFNEFESEAILAIDFESKKLIGLSFRRNHFVQEETYGDYYTPVIQNDDLVFGHVSQLTETLGMFTAFCKDEYTDLLPNYTGSDYFKDIDLKASIAVDAQIKHVFKNAANDDLKYLGMSNEPRHLDEILNELEKTKNFALKTHWDFYFQSIQSVRTKN